jgi:hypothetical protein
VIVDCSARSAPTSCFNHLGMSGQAERGYADLEVATRLLAKLIKVG